MIFRALAVILAVTVFSLLSACQKDIAVEIRTRPAMVTHPVPAADAVATFPGEVRARFEPELAFRIGGKISRRLVDVGQSVKKDQPLAELDPEDVKLQLEAIKSQVAAAEANLQLVKSERDRYKELLGRQVISRSQYENAENLYSAGQARLSQVRAEYSVASNQAGYAVLRATQDGVIASRYAEVGQVVSAGQKVFTLAVRGDREVAINLPENSQGYVSVGQQVMINLWSQPGELYPGAVRELAPAADAMSRTFAARVAFLDPHTPAELGQSARVFFRVEGEIPLSVPLSAVSAEAGDPFVYVVNPVTSALQRRSVKIGAFGETGVPVLAGLTTEDWVVVAGVQVLRDGQVVRPVDRDNRAVELAGGE
jgi:multidrug efflux system membrane fusion protein